LKLATAAVLVLILLGLLLPTFIVQVQGTGGSWLTGWLYRKSHVINKATGAGTNYQVCIKVYKGGGTDGNETVNGFYCGKVYTGGLCLDDFGDIRFTDDDGATLLVYWIEDNTLVSANSAIFWVKVADSLETDAQTIYVYYGKPSATSISDVEHTFLAGDDFDTGSSPNATTWSVTGSPTISSGILTCTTGQQILGTATVGATGLVWYGRGNYEGASLNQIGIHGLADSAGNNGIYFYMGEVKYIRVLKDGASSLSAVTIAINTYHLWTAFWTASNNATFWQDAVKLGEMATNVPIVAIPIKHFSRATYGPTINVDFTVCRKYTGGIEPTHDNWGTQEVASYVTVYFNAGTADGCGVYLDNVACTNGTAANAKLAFTLAATENGTSLFMFANFTFIEWANSTDQNPVTLTLTANLTIWIYYVDKPLPVARFEFSPTNPVVDQPVVFDGSQSYAPYGAITSYNWWFVDGGTNFTNWISPTTVHTFTAAGTYNVTLTITAGAYSNVSAFIFHLVNVTAAPTYAVARFDFNPTNPAPGDLVVFNATQSYNTTDVSFSWDFGDGNTTLISDSFLVVHSFAVNTTYVVGLELHGTATGLNSSMVFRYVNVSYGGGGTAKKVGPVDLAGYVIAGVISVLLLIAVIIIVRRRH
jgi:PKD repeat protein